MGMMGPPQIVARPGVDGSASSGCELSGTTSVADGPYAGYGGKTYSKNAVRELARYLGLVITDEAQETFERLLGQLAALKVDHEATLTQMNEREQEGITLSARVDDLQAEIAELHADRDRQATLADVAAEFIAAAAKASKPTEPTKTRKVAA